MKHVLAAVDGSECSIRAARTASEYAKTFGVPLSLLTAVPLPLVPTDGMVDIGPIVDASIEGGHAMLSEVAAAIERPDAERICLEGASTEGIVKWADDNGVDLIVVGSKGRNALSRMLIGTTTDRLVHLAKVPVLVVR